MIQYNPTVSGSLVVTGSLITTGNINGINLSTFSASINNALTESKVTHIVSASAGIYYIDGTSKPSMSVVPGLTYRFETAIVDIHHPFKFSTSQNGPIQYVNGVTSGSNFIQLEVNYDTPDVLYYYCTIHNNMGNAINVLKIDKLLTVVSSSFDSRYVISGSITQTTWDNIASKPAGIVSSSVQVLGGTNIVSGSSQLTASALATTGSNTFIGNQSISGTLYLTGSLIPSGNFVYDLGSATNSFGDLYISTGSIRFHNPDGTEQGRITVDARSGDISLLKTVGLTNEQKLTIKEGNINPTFLSAISASSLFVQTKIVTAASATINGINLTAFSSSVSNTILNQNAATSSYETKGRSIVSGSSQVVGSSITTNTITIGSTSTALGGTSTTLAGLTSVSSTGFTGALTGNASTATTAAALTTARTINGTSFDGSANITIPNLVSGSSQITLSSTTGYGSVLNQAVLTSSSPTFAGGTMTGTITSNVTNNYGLALNRATTSNYNGISLQTAAVAQWYVGMRENLSSNNYIIYNESGTDALTISKANSNATFAGTITETSSLRYKENVETIKYGLDKVLQMRGVTYDKKDNGVKEIGVIAEEIYEVLPELVLKNEEGEIDSVSYSRITAVLIEAIKDLKKEIEDLKANR